MIVRRSLPRFVEVGVPQTLTIDVYSDAGALQTTTAATLTVWRGTEKLLDGVTATPGAHSSYPLLAVTTADREPSEDYLEVWSCTIGGSPYTFQVPGYLVRRAYYPSIVDEDLTDRHAELATFATQTGEGFQTKRDEANVELQLDLLRRGKRPWLVFDAFVLRRAHIFKTLELLFNDYMSVVGDGKYERLRDRYAAAYAECMKDDNFRYDTAQTGTIDDTRQHASTGPVYVTAGPYGGHARGYSTP